MGALRHRSVGQGALRRVSNYPAEPPAQAAQILRALGTPLLIHQPAYSMLDRWIEPELLGRTRSDGSACIAYSPLAQGLLTGKYLSGVPAGSRASGDGTLAPEGRSAARSWRTSGRSVRSPLARGQSLAQLALAWVLRDPRMTSALIGASSVAQLEENLAAAGNTTFSAAELAAIDRLAAGAGTVASGFHQAAARWVSHLACRGGQWCVTPIPGQWG